MSDEAEEYLWEVSGFTMDENWTWYVSSDSVFEAMKEAFRHKPWHSEKGIKVRMIPNFSPFVSAESDVE